MMHKDVPARDTLPGTGQKAARARARRQASRRRSGRTGARSRDRQLCPRPRACPRRSAGRRCPHRQMRRTCRRAVKSLPRWRRPLALPSARCAGGWLGSARANLRRFRTVRAYNAGSAHRLPQRVLVLIGWLRQRLRLTGAVIARKLDPPHSTIARWLTRSGLGGPTDHEPPARAALPA